MSRTQTKTADPKRPGLLDAYQVACQACERDWIRLKRAFNRLDKRLASMKRLLKRLKAQELAGSEV